MRTNTEPYMLYMSKLEKEFLEEMAWRNKVPMARYIKNILRLEMEKNPEIVEEVEKRIEA